MLDSFHKKQTPWIVANIICQELINVKQRVYDPSGFKCTQPVMEPESSEYGAYTFEVNGFSVRFRVAITMALN